MKESAEEELSSALKNTSTNSRLGGGTSDTLWESDLSRNAAIHGHSSNGDLVP